MQIEFTDEQTVLLIRALRIAELEERGYALKLSREFKAAPDLDHADRLADLISYIESERNAG